MNKVLLALLIGGAALTLIGSGVVAASWFWTGQAVPGIGSNFAVMPMMSALRLPAFISNWVNNPGSSAYGCGQSIGSGANYGGMMGGRGFGGMMGGRGFGGMMGGRGFGGMMGGRGSQTDYSNSCPFTNPGSSSPTGPRLTMDQARVSLETYLAADANLVLSEIMEFDQNFYAVILEKDTGRGAMELLVDPYSGAVSPEYGPNMMWNEKYGHMGGWYATTGSTLTLDEAGAAAQSALDKAVPGAMLEGMGIEFYGYFTFDYAIDGQIAGMLSVHNNGQTWLHTWHGSFLGEVELTD